MKGPPTWMLFVFGLCGNAAGTLNLWYLENPLCLGSAFLAGAAFLALLSRSSTAVRTADKD